MPATTTKPEVKPVPAPVHSDPVMAARIAINRAFYSMPYGSGCNFQWADCEKETEQQFTERVKRNIEALRDKLRQHAEMEAKDTEELQKLRGQKRAIQEFLRGAITLPE